MYDPQEIFRSAASVAALGCKLVKLWGVRDDASCTCSKGVVCESSGKHPVDVGWPATATDDEETIARWFDDCNENVRWNVGVSLGAASGIIDIEADSPEATAAISRYGIDQVDTIAYKSSRGSHFWFQWEPDFPDVAILKIEGIEVRLGGERAAQSVIPKSWHRTGKQYEWLPGRSPEETTIAKVPDEFRKLIIDNARYRKSGAVASAIKALANGEAVGVGGRHQHLVGVASWLAMRCSHYSDEERRVVLALVQGANQILPEPKGQEEVFRIANAQFDHYRRQREERRNRRTGFERYGLVWNPESSEWDPGEWRLTIVYSDPVQYRLTMPPQDGDHRPVRVLVDPATFQSAPLMSQAVSLAAPQVDLKATAGWGLIWNGGSREVDGERREVTSLRLKLLHDATHETVAPELKRYVYTAVALQNYLRRFEKFNPESQEDDSPNVSGIPKWRRVTRASGPRDELWFQWNETWDQIRQKKKEITGADVKSLRDRLLEVMREKHFPSEVLRVQGKQYRWRVWTDAWITALEMLADDDSTP